MTATTFAGLETRPVNKTSPDYGKWLVHGPQGSGKSSLAGTISEFGKTLFVDLVGEHGTQSLIDSQWADNIDVVRPQSAQAMDDIFWQLAAGGHGYRAVVIDSLTSLQKMAMRFMLGHDETAVREIRKNTAPADQRTWGQTLDIMTDTATFWYGLAGADKPEPMHVVMTAQTKITENEETGAIQRVPDVQRGALSIVLSTPSFILYTDVEDDIDNIGEDGTIGQRHIVRFGDDPAYRIKTRLSPKLRGKIPPVLGRDKPIPTLGALSRALGVGGAPKKARPAAAAAAPSSEAASK